MLTKAWGSIRLYAFEQVGVVAGFSELHQEIEVMFFILVAGVSVLEKIFVDFELHVGEADENVDFLFGRESFFDLDFGSS